MEQQSRLEDIAQRHRVRLIVQFGSSVKGFVHAGSDLDLAVQLEEASEFRDELDLRADLQALFPDQEVDLAIINRADPLFLKQIVQGCRLLYGTERQLAELEMLAFKRYQDHRRYLALEEEYVGRALQVPVP